MKHEGTLTPHTGRQTDNMRHSSGQMTCFFPTMTLKLKEGGGTLPDQ